MSEPRSRPLQSPPATRSNQRRRETSHADVTWLDITQPSNNDLALLRERYHFDSLSLEDVASTIQRPKFDLHLADEYVFAIFQAPLLDRNNRVVSSELDVFAGRDVVVTVHTDDSKPLRRIYSALSTDEQARAQVLGRGPGYVLYRILDAFFKQIFATLYYLDDEISRVDGRLYAADTRNVVREIAALQREVASLRAILKPNLAAIQLLRDRPSPFLRVDATRYFGDCADALNKLWELSEEQYETAQSFSRTLDSLALQRTAQLNRFVVLLLILLLPLVLIGSLSALNAAVLVTIRPLIFGAIVLVGFAISAALLGYARFREWI